jgi:putative ABC transport system permease protein
MVMNGTIPALANQHTGMRPYELTLGDEAAIRRLPEVRAVTGELARSDLYEVSQWSNTSAHLGGNEPSYTVVRYLPIAAGRFLDDEDVRDVRRVVFIAQKSASILFQGRPMVGQTISINGIGFTVIGVGAKVGRGNNTYDDEKMYIPITTMQEFFPLKGDNIPQDALNSIQYNPTIKNDNTAADIAVHRVIAQRHGSIHRSPTLSTSLTPSRSPTSSAPSSPPWTSSWAASASSRSPWEPLASSTSCSFPSLSAPAKSAS